MTTVRRFGLENSQTRASLLDAAERIMCDEGYAAVTSRRVATVACLKPQLVHYYFRNMDELFLAMLRRRMEENYESLKRALASSQPLRALWAINADPRVTALTLEFSALANHRKAIRSEIASYAEQVRTLQAEAFARLPADGFAGTHAPIVWTLLMLSISRILVMEQSLGISGGHAEMLALVESYLAEFERSSTTVAAM
jgi:TetR/AcrR family transcriptional regulator